MRNKAIKFILLYLLIGICTQIAKAEINIANSIEWLVAHSDLIVKGNITYVDMKGEKIICTIEITDGLKGSLSVTTLDFSMPMSQEQTDRLKKIMVANKDVLVFLKNINAGKKKLAPEYTPVLNEGNATYYIVDLNNAGSTLISAFDFKVLKDAASIIQKCRSVSSQINTFLEKKKKYEFKKYLLEIPTGSEAYKVLYSGSSCFLYVPDALFPSSKSGFH